MSISPLPAPLPQLTGRRFSFYPAILNIRCNQWMYRRATWSEIVVVNTATGEEACIPRMFLGGASRIDEPVVVVELKRELEWRDGVVCPHRCLVIELPVAANDAAAAPHPENPAPVVSIRLEAPRELRAGRKIGVALVIGALGCLITADIARQIQTHQRTNSFRSGAAFHGVRAGDDYYTVVRKLGMPSSDRTFVTAGVVPGARVFRELTWTRERFTLVLMGATLPEARYIGALDLDRRPLDTGRLPDGTNAGPLLRSVPGF